MKGLTAKDFAIYKANEIKQLCGDLKYAQNKDLKIFGITYLIATYRFILDEKMKQKIKISETLLQNLLMQAMKVEKLFHY